MLRGEEMKMPLDLTGNVPERRLGMRTQLPPEENREMPRRDLRAGLRRVGGYCEGMTPFDPARVAKYKHEDESRREPIKGERNEHGYIPFTKEDIPRISSAIEQRGKFERLMMDDRGETESVVIYVDEARNSWVITIRLGSYGNREYVTYEDIITYGSETLLRVLNLTLHETWKTYTEKHPYKFRGTEFIGADMIGRPMNSGSSSPWSTRY